MDTGAMGGRLQEWVRDQVPVGVCISTDDLKLRAEHADLPEEAKDAVRALPSGEWSRDALAHDLVDILETRAGGGARGFGVGLETHPDRQDPGCGAGPG
jgi:hypothetical protein